MKEKEKCYSCGGKGTYSQMHGIHGSEDFGGEGYQKPAMIKNYPCKPCNGTGLNQEGKKCECESVDGYEGIVTIENCELHRLSPEESHSDWKEKEREAFENNFGYQDFKGSQKAIWNDTERMKWIADYWLSRIQEARKAERERIAGELGQGDRIKGKINGEHCISQREAMLIALSSQAKTND